MDSAAGGDSGLCGDSAAGKAEAGMAEDLGREEGRIAALILSGAGTERAKKQRLGYGLIDWANISEIGRCRRVY
jgi:hypothetical protein